jgi:diaminohydroxyphosphoribosylaminopyrimidine deaminase/5-amino-6-(5-phosphoribosylamino)uracil reductase
MSSDDRFMAAALNLGRRGLGLTAPNPSVGALIVRGDYVVGRGVTAPGGRPHAETQAIAEAGEAARGATLYVTLEPCSHHGRTPPCAEAVVAAGISRVVCAIEDPDARVAGQGLAILRAAGIVVVTGVGAEEARRGHLGHIRRVVDGRPMVTLKLARTADFFAAGEERDPRLAITGETANLRVGIMRAMHDAIMIGVGTAIADDPLLTVRFPGGGAFRPLRVVLDAAARLSPRSRLAATANEFPTLVIMAPDAPEARAAGLREVGVEVAVSMRNEDGRLDLQSALRLLGARGLTRIFSEGGPRVGAALIAEGLADEIVLVTAPKPLGRPGLPALDAAASAALEDRDLYEAPEIARLGIDEMRVIRKKA